MNILIMSPVFPYPLDNGGKIRTYNIVKNLSRHHKITFACLSGAKVDDDGPLREFCEEIICIERKANTVRDLLTSLLSRSPFNCVRFRSWSFKDALQKLGRQRSFDIVHIDSTLLWQYAELFSGTSTTLGTHNVEYQIIAQLGKACRNPLKKALYALERKKLINHERRAWRECSLCFAVSDVEQSLINSYLDASDKVITAPNGVDLERFAFRLKVEAGRNLLFLGGMDYLPNLDSAGYFLQEIYPLIEARMPGVTVDFVGRELWRLGIRSSSRGITLNENVPDVVPWFEKADALVVPLRMGAGTRLKVLEAMAAGVPVVTTTKGCEGIAAVHDTHLLVADSSEDFARQVVRLLQNDGLRTSVAHNARRLVEQKYSWSSIVGDMEAELRKLPQAARREDH